MKKLILGLLILLSIFGVIWCGETQEEMLLRGVRTGDYPVVVEAIANGANVNYFDAYGKSVFMYACEKQDIPIMKKLLESGVNPSFKNDFGQNAIMYACKYVDNESMLKILSDSGVVNINDCDNGGKTALMYSIENKSTNALVYLLKRGVNVNAADNNGNDALILAVKNKNELAVKKLMEKTVNWSQTDENGNNAFMIACENGSLNMVRFMLTGNNAFDLNTKTSTGLPILFWLIDKRKSNRIIEYVMEYIGGYGQIIGMEDDFGNDIYYYAELRNNITVLEKLDELEARYKEAKKKTEAKADERKSKLKRD